MAITNQSKPSTSYSNAAKVSIGETWASIDTTWASETRTWLAISQLIANSARALSYSLWSAQSLPWQMEFPWQHFGGGITNETKQS